MAAKHILIVDNDTIIQTTLSDSLRLQGYIPVTATTGKEALTRAKAEKFTVALIALMLEDIPGLLLMKQIKEIWPDTECIVLAEPASQTSALEAVNLGAYGYLQKPYNTEQLLVTIHRAIEKQETEALLRRINRAYRVLNSGIKALHYATEEQQLLHEVCQIIVNVGEYRLAWIGFAEQDEAKTIRPVAQAGYEEGYLNTVNIRWADTERGRGPSGVAIRTGKPSINSNTLTHPNYHLWRNESIQRGYASSIALPLSANKQTLGVLNVYALEPDSFDPEEVNLLMQLAHDLAHGILALRIRIKHEQAEQALRESENRFRNIVEQSNDGIVLTDEQGYIIEWNHGIEQITGLKQNDVTGRPIWDVQFQLAPDDLSQADYERIKAGILVFFTTGQAPWINQLQESVIKRADETLRTVQSTIFPVKTDTGFMVGSIFRDITGQIRVEEELRKLSWAVEQSPVSVVITNKKGDIEYVNPKFTQITGYTFNEVVGKNPRILKSNELAPETYQRLWKTITAGKEWRGEFHNKKKSGELYWELASISPVRTPNGNITHFVAVKEDITERKQVEYALKESEERFRQVVVSISDHVYVTQVSNNDHTNLYISPNVENLTGYPQEKFLDDWSFWGTSVIYPEDRVAATQMARLRKGRNSEVEYRLTRADGEVIWVRDSARVEQAGNLKIIYGVVNDITDRKQAEKNLEWELAVSTALSELYEPLTSSTATITDIADTVLDWAKYLTNSALGFVSEIDSVTGEHTGHIQAEELKNQGQVLEKHQSIIFSVEADKRYGGLWRHALNTKKAFFTNAPQNHTSSTGVPAGHIPFHAFLAVPALIQGNVVGQIALANPGKNYTEQDLDAIQRIAEFYAVSIQRKQAEKEIRVLNEELEQRVIDRTRELSALYDVAAIGSEIHPLNTTLKRSLERVLDAANGYAGTVHLLNETDKTLYLAAQQNIPSTILSLSETSPIKDPNVSRILKQNEPLIIPNLDSTAKPPFGVVPDNPHTYVGVSMRAGGRTVGILSIFGKEPQQFNVEEISLLTSVADQVAVAVENTRLRQRDEHAAVMEERERLARDLHDSMTQSLYSLTLFAEAGLELAKTDDMEAVKHNFARMGQTAQNSLKEMRMLVYELRPLDLAKEGLVGALHHRLNAVEQRVNIKARLVAEALIEPSPAIEKGLYRIAQEALNNVLKHSQATTVTIYLRTENNNILLEIVDNGTGFNLKTTSEHGGLGLTSIQQRVQKLNGTLTINSTLNKGTRIKVTVNNS